MTVSDQKRRSVPELSGASLDYAIELLTFAATDYSKTNLKPSAEEYLLITELVNLGLLKGESVRDANGAVTGILAGEITAEGAKFLAELKTKKKSTHRPALTRGSNSSGHKREVISNDSLGQR